MQTKFKTVFLSIILTIGFAAPSAHAIHVRIDSADQGPPSGVGTNSNAPTDEHVNVNETPPDDRGPIDEGDPIPPETELVNDFSRIAEPGPSVSVPEPSTLALLLSVPAALFLRRRVKA